MKSDINRYLSDWSDEYSNNSDMKDCIKWHENLSDGFVDHKYKIIVSDFVRRAAQMNNFRVYMYPVISYTGYASAKMVHFMFECLLDSEATLPVHSRQTSLDIFKLPLLVSESGKLNLHTQQPQLFDLINFQDTWRNQQLFSQNLINW